MSGRGKRIWTHRLSFDDAYQETLRFLTRAREHNLLTAGAPALYQVYRVSGQWPVDGLQDISHFLRFGFDNNPQTDRARQALARLLSVVLKAHFFLEPQAIVLHEPYVFSMPDLAQPGQSRYGLVYPLEQGGKPMTLVVAEWDLAMSASRWVRVSAADRFPVVLPGDTFRWIPLKHWRALRADAEKQPWFESGAGFTRQRFLDSVRKHTDAVQFPYGTLLDYPRDLNDEVRAVGGIWASGIRKWFLPHGWDVPVVQEYLKGFEQQSEMERYQQRWYRPAPYPAAKDAKD